MSYMGRWEGITLLGLLCVVEDSTSVENTTKVSFIIFCTCNCKYIYVPEKKTVKTHKIIYSCSFKSRKLSINKTVLKIINKAFSLPVENETANHENFMLMSLMPIFSCLEV